MLNIKNLKKEIKGNNVINNISFTIKENEIIALIGPNGSGKTTLLNLICNLEKANEGSISLNKMSIHNNPDIFNYITYMQDSTTLYKNLTGYDHLDFIARVHKIGVKDIEEIIMKLKLSNFINKKVSSYSLGMRQQLLFALAIMSKPKILILDEPFNGLDFETMKFYEKIIIDLKANNVSVLLSSHLLSELDKIADKIIFIKKGEIVSIVDIGEKDKDNFILHLNNNNDLEKTRDIFVDNNVEISNINNISISFSISKEKLNKLLEELKRHNIEIMLIEKIKVSEIEKYYNIIYGDKYE